MQTRKTPQTLNSFQKQQAHKLAYALRALTYGSNNTKSFQFSTCKPSDSTSNK